MKKLSLLIIFALTLLLTACGTKPALSQPPQDTSKNLENELIPLSRYNGKGLYFEDPATSGPSFPFESYIDKETATQVPLCNEPSCAHSSPDCTAVFNTIGTLYAHKDKLLYFSTGLSSGNSDKVAYSDAIEMTSIISATSAGANRKSLCSGSFDFLTGCPPAVKGDDLFFFTQSNGEIYLSCLNLQTNVLTNSPQKLDYISYLGVYKSSFVVYTLGFVDNFHTKTISLINTSDGSIRSLAEVKSHSDSNETNSLAYYNGKVYNLKSTKSQEFDVLNAIDCETGETVLVSNEIKNQSSEGQEISNTIDETLIIRSLQSGNDKSLPEYRSFTFNLKTKQQGELTLYVQSPVGNYIAPLSLHYDLGDSVLVVEKSEYVKKICSGIFGAPYLEDTTEDIYAIISKEDYLNNNPVFKTITKTRVK